MGIDISCLSPKAQKQIADKLLADMRSKASVAEKKSKYGNRKTEACGIKFDSKKEAERFRYLKHCLEAGQISDLRLQQAYTLQEAYITPDGERVRAIKYIADFVYTDCESGRVLVEDVKSKGTVTAVYGMKKKMMQEKFGINVREV